ncbi:MAG TPA: NADH-quinone oxidoreductase subunit L [Phycisphaerales bacterium]|nr:NADH-quinone oxidoreductase subunit L [Phycisphaerales bacterium]HMP36858.1 NADH-quinone oxidoreductase subunit L [Phycisphaerales bacterium]
MSPFALLAATGTATVPIDAASAAAAIPAAIARPELAWAGWILWLPAISAILCTACAAFRVKGKLPAWITIGLLGIASVLVFALYGRVDGPTTIHLFDWIDIAWTGRGPDAPREGIVASFAFYVDGLSLLWMCFVVPLGTLIALYASEYMEPDVGRGYPRFFAGVSIFLFAMSCLVLGDNLVLLYLGWEGVGFASYLLVGYYYTKPSAVAAAKKAFIVNRVGDLGLALGIFLIWLNYGTVEYDGLFHALAASGGEGEAGWSVRAIPFLLMLAAFGKSAQLPLYVWLPDAMEGPTPVSALIHAATMVTAGVYLIARTYPLFHLDPLALPLVAWVGGLTALFAATIGMAQHDIKRIMAYSTISQLGYMFLGLGAITAYGAVYHVFTHAFFKAVLFLTCGAIMHGFAGQLDLRKLSGLAWMPGWRVVAWTMLVGCLALAGFPGLSGYFSKDLILAEAFVSSETRPGWGYAFLGWLGLATAAMTAYYAFRVWFRVCAGPVHFEPGDEAHDAAEDHGGHDGHADHAGHAAAGHDDHGGHGSGGFHPHAPRLAINGVLVILAIGAVLAALPCFIGGDAAHPGWVEWMAARSSAASGVPPHDVHAHPAAFFGLDPHKAMYYVSAVFGIVGLSIAAWLHLLDRGAADRLRNALLAHPLLRWIPLGAERKWYVDELYDIVIRMPLWFLGHVLGFIDRYIVDGLLVDGIARIPRFFGRFIQPLQNGVLQGYAVAMAGGIAFIVAGVVVLFWIWRLGA